MGADSAFNRDDPRPYDPPHALLITRERTDDPDPYEVARLLSGRIERFLLLARLFGAGTVYPVFEVNGLTTLVARVNSRMTIFRGGRPLVRRTVWVNEQHGPAFDAIGALVDEADVSREGMAATSYDVAISKFHRSHHQENPYEHLVDLATALEAILAGGEKENEGLTLRLRNRAAALLAADNDHATAVFDDVGLLYGLRSKLVHGGQIKRNDMKRDLRKLSTMPADAVDQRFGVALGYAVDRMRDLVRRAILARLCLAARLEPEPDTEAEPKALWPFSGATAVDALLSDDATRAHWRSSWHEKLTALGVGDAAKPPREAVDFLTPQDEENRARRQPSVDAGEHSPEVP
jgi:hypothetical protein